MALSFKLAEMFVEFTKRDVGLTRMIDNVHTRLRGLRAAIDRIGQLAQRIFLPLAGGFAAVVKTAGDFQSAMTQSTAIMGTMDDRTRKALDAQARSLTDLGVRPKDAAAAYFFLASAGLSAEQSLVSLESVARFAKAGMFDLSLATDLLTDAQSALGLKSSDTGTHLTNLIRVSDVLVKANTLANATVQQFSEAMTNGAGAAARQVGKDVEEVTAVLAAFADQGTKGAAAGTAFAIILRDLQTQGLKNKQAFKNKGIAVFDDAGEMRNIADIIEDIEGALAGMSDEQAKSTLLALGFTDKSVKFIQTLLGTSSAIRNYEKDLRAASGITEEVSNKQLQAINEQWGIFRAKLENAAITFGERLLPVVQRAITFVNGLLDAITQLTTAQVDQILKVALWVAGISGALIVLPVLVKILAGLFAMLAPGALLFGAIAAALGMVAAGFVLTYGEGETFMERLMSIGESITDFLMPKLEAFGSFLATVFEEAKFIIDNFVDIWDLMVVQLGTAMLNIIETIENTTNIIIEALALMGDLMMKQFKTAFDNVLILIQNAGVNINQAWDAIMRALWAGGSFEDFQEEWKKTFFLPLGLGTTPMQSKDPSFFTGLAGIIARNSHLTNNDDEIARILKRIEDRADARAKKPAEQAEQKNQAMAIAASIAATMGLVVTGGIGLGKVTAIKGPPIKPDDKSTTAAFVGLADMWERVQMAAFQSTEKDLQEQVVEEQKRGNEINKEMLITMNLVNDKLPQAATFS